MTTPLLTPWRWRRMLSTRPLRRIAAALWCLCEIPGDDPVWMPFAPADIEEAARAADGVFRAAGVHAGDVVLAVAPGGPWLGNVLPYLLAAADSLLPGGEVIGAEVIPLSVLTASYRPDLTLFPFERAPSVLLGPRAELRAVLELADSQRIPPLQPRLALVYGDARDGGRDTHDGAPAPNDVELLYLPGALAPFGGSPQVEGIWLPSSRVRCEVISDDEWARSVAFPHVTPRALPAHEAEGVTGELVVTVPNHVHPLSRFRTQRRIALRSVEAAGVWISLLDGPRKRAADPVGPTGTLR